MNGTLVDLSAEIAELERRMDGADDPQALEALVFAYLDTQEHRDVKLDNYAALITELEARAQVRKAEADRMAQRAKADADRAGFLKARLVWFFTSHDLKTVETPRYRLTLAKNGGRPSVELLVPEDQIAPEFLREVVTVKADKDAIRTVLEAGQMVDGAILKERGYSIRIS